MMQSCSAPELTARDVSLDLGDTGHGKELG